MREKSEQMLEDVAYISMRRKIERRILIPHLNTALQGDAMC
jgi:hypothetical protein